MRSGTLHKVNPSENLKGKEKGVERGQKKKSEWLDEEARGKDREPRGGVNISRDLGGKGIKKKSTSVKLGYLRSKKGD